ncbi:hypothetical protein TGGT1_309880 [Toxoplasma gondii GT1]|uniref:Uncharacterized protein n=4 Tax=Toxoplasma gondii TaxID=5811 RepID=S7W7T0_TOXGG|nr:hypothetical protein TGGT1_309880 [Toxoplasma gondii GT1]KAF4639166.1 hypothetical protein TGRH88_049380 [Toxoplasma gondii]KFG40687.1 hypothetical protein TGP89_309880 [Toxoplasma gondii p89]KFH02483.1 hypothetical protein TGVAND_309880 [Toxoplasma gondii VAND]
MHCSLSFRLGSCLCPRSSMVTHNVGTHLRLPTEADHLSQPRLACPTRECGDAVAASTFDMATNSPFRTFFVGGILEEEGELSGTGIGCTSNHGRSSGTEKDLTSKCLLDSRLETADEGTTQGIGEDHDVSGVLVKTQEMSFASLKQPFGPAEELNRLEPQGKWDKIGRDITEGRCTSTTSASTLSGSKDNYSSLHQERASSSTTEVDAHSFGSFSPVAFPQTCASRPCSVSSLLSASLVCLVTAPGCSSPHEAPGDGSTPSLSFPPSQLSGEVGYSDSEREGVASLGTGGTSLFLDVPPTSHTPDGSAFASDAAWSFSPSTEAGRVLNMLTTETDPLMEYGPEGLREEAGDEALESLPSNLTYASFCRSQDGGEDAESKEARPPVLWHPAKYSPWPNSWRCGQGEKSGEASPGLQRRSPHGLIGPISRSMSEASPRHTSTTASATEPFAETPTLFSVGKTGFGSQADDEHDEPLLAALKPMASFPSHVSQTSASTFSCISAPISPSKLPEATKLSDVQSPSSRRSNASSGGFFPHSDTVCVQRDDGRKEIEGLAVLAEENGCHVVLKTDMNQTGNSRSVPGACSVNRFDQNRCANGGSERWLSSGSGSSHKQNMPMRTEQAGADTGHTLSRPQLPWSRDPQSATETAEQVFPECTRGLFLSSSSANLCASSTSFFDSEAGQGHLSNPTEHSTMSQVPNREQPMVGSENSQFHGWVPPCQLPRGPVYRDTGFRPPRNTSHSGGPLCFHPGYPLQEVSHTCGDQMGSNRREDALSPNAALLGLPSVSLHASESVGPDVNQSWNSCPRNTLLGYTSVGNSHLEGRDGHAVMVPQLQEGEVRGRGSAEQMRGESFRNGFSSGFPVSQGSSRSASSPDCENFSRPFLSAGCQSRPTFPPPPPPGPRPPSRLPRVCSSETQRRPFVATLQEPGGLRPGFQIVDCQRGSGAERGEAAPRVRQETYGHGNAPFRDQATPYDACPPSQFLDNGEVVRGKQRNGTTESLKGDPVVFGARCAKVSRPVPPPPGVVSHADTSGALPHPPRGVESPSGVTPFPLSGNFATGNPEQRSSGLDSVHGPFGISSGVAQREHLLGQAPLNFAGKQSPANPSNSPPFLRVTGDIRTTLAVPPQRPASPMSLTLNRLLAAYAGPAPEKLLSCPSSVPTLHPASSAPSVQRVHREWAPGGGAPGLVESGSRGATGKRQVVSGKGSRIVASSKTSPVNVEARQQNRNERFQGGSTPQAPGAGKTAVPHCTLLPQPAGAWLNRMTLRGVDDSAMEKCKKERGD